MDSLKVHATYRTDMSKSRTKELRRTGFVPASVFGHDTEPLALEVNLVDLVHQIRAAEAGSKSLIDLKISGGPKKSDGTVILKAFRKDPITRKVLDIQFQRVTMTEKVHVEVPVELVGESAGAKLGGILEKNLDDLLINVLPGKIPPRVEVDVTNLGVGEHISVADLKFDDFEILTSPDALVCACVAHHVGSKAAEETIEVEEQ